MADKKYLDETGLSYLWSKIKASHAKIEYKTKAQWDAMSTLVSVKGTVYVYTDYNTDMLNGQPGYKIGDGATLLIDKAFENDAADLYDHLDDTTVHITAAERTKWDKNNYFNVTYSANETFICTTTNPN